jgi:ABC-type branched-subunit amino acid transport system substrate-binding protein
MGARLKIGACLSLTGRFAAFGTQAAAGLETWRQITEAADLVIEDDRSGEWESVERKLPDVAARSDLLLGPYSTILMRRAGNLAAEHGWLVWNQGGSGDDVESAHPGHVVSVLTPTSRYAVPFVRLLGAGERLVIAQGPGSFGRQVTDGAEAAAKARGVHVTRAGQGVPPSGEWSLLSSGVFEDDAWLVADAMEMPNPPKRICAIAAGVRQFADVIENPEGIYGIAQWFPGSKQQPELGPPEDVFLQAYNRYAHSFPDYPAIQALAGAVIALHCAQLAGSTERAALWEAAASLEISTLFGNFAIDGRGKQLAHPTALVRWENGQLRKAGLPA